jgi:transcription-repair coupling factor (superfamily II helicase)
LHRLRNRLDGHFGASLSGFLEKIGMGGGGALEIANVRGSARQFLLSYLAFAKRVSPVLIVCESNREAERMRAHCIAAYRLYSGKVEDEKDFLVYPDFEPSNLFDFTPPDVDVTGARRAAEDALLRGNAKLIFTCVQALFKKIPHPDKVRASRLHLKCGKSAGRDAVCLTLDRFGYERKTMVMEPGEYAVRGGLLDVFPIGDQNPVRIDFFGDDIDEMSRFEPSTQRSFEAAAEAVVLPVVQLDTGDAEDGASKLEKLLAAYLREFAARLPGSAAGLEQAAKEDIARIAENRQSPRYEIYSPILSGGATFLDYLPQGALVFVHDETLVSGELKTYERFWRERFREWRKGALTFADFDDYYAIPDRADAGAVIASVESRPGISTLFTSSFDRRHLSFEGSDLSFGTPSSSQYSLGALPDGLRKLGGGTSEVWIASQFAERLRERLIEEEIAVAAIENAILPGGFTLPGQGMLLTDAEIFGEIEEAVYRKPKRFEKSGLRSLEEIKVGDYVVHVDYGVGRFVALTDQELGGIKRSYVQIEYEGRDKLYVPVDQLDRLRQYRYDGSPPKLNSLGRKQWQKTKRKVRQEAIKLALRLYQLYRKRERMQGHSFVGVDNWMAEFENGFPYELTPDQYEAWGAVYNDMAAAKPMDRLICGDVGFGKTEVALRAAFLACLNNKQVLVMCPTTVLADQHYHTFRRRFAAFPFRVEMLSRFLSDADQKRIAADIAKGKVDVVIGTHRALSADVKFPRLGLLVIDEEQRFGVKQKERLKMRNPGVDVLTLTATPIPRTLHMSLVGLRDVSLIETAPVDRKPVRTYVGEYNETLVRDAILKEIGRGGQVYFLHNRIADIDVFRSELEKLVPEAKIIVGHGRMKEDKLEEIMNAFSMGAYNILLATTIIENGLDIPNVNTLIVQHAEYLGLSQMHQLRGRVGRSHVQAYAYFYHDPARSLSEDAQSRLHSIYNYAYLGAGYEIAQSDLRLRGAGNVFGEEQSGLAATVGFDYYFEMLTNSMEKLKEELDSEGEFSEDEFLDAMEEEPEGCMIDIPISAYIPHDYIEDSIIRLDILRRIARLKDGEVNDLRTELEDRFGALPAEVENLIGGIEVKIAAEACGVSNIEYLPAREKFKFKFHSGRPAWANRITLLDGKAEVSTDGSILFALRMGEDALDKIKVFLGRMRALAEKR